MEDRSPLSTTWMAGFALAATVLEDPAPPFDRLESQLREEAVALWQELRAMAPAKRRAWMRSTAEQLQTRRAPVSSLAPLPPRARAIMASEVPRDLGRQWLSEAPSPRRGFRPPSALRDAIRNACIGAKK